MIKRNKSDGIFFKIKNMKDMAIFRGYVLVITNKKYIKIQAKV